MNDESPPQNTDFARQYGTNWTITNVGTLFEWVNISAYNIRCLEMCINRYRMLIRNQTVLGLILSTLSGTIAVSQFGANDGSIRYNVIQGIFTAFAFAMTISAGALKVYQVQERLEQTIKLKQEWTVFATTIASELQLPIELRRDALFMIKKHKDTYLDLMKSEIEIPESIKAAVVKDLPHAESSLDCATLPRTIINICNQELADMKSANQRNKDRFTARPKNTAQQSSATTARETTPPASNTSINAAFPDSVVLTVAAAPPLPSAVPASVPALTKRSFTLPPMPPTLSVRDD